MLAYLQLLGNPSNDVALLLRVINTPTRGIGKTTVQRLVNHATRYGMTVLEAAPRVPASRVAQQKGRCADRQVCRDVRPHGGRGRRGPIEELLGTVLTESGYQKQLEDSDREEDLQRLANIEQLLSVGRDFDEQHPGDGPPRSVPRRNQPGGRYRRLGRRKRSGDPS